MEALPSVPTIIWTFLLLLSILVFVHEWGHFIVARLFGVKVETFSIGFGRELFGWTDKKGTRWKICWLPLGGYVKFYGDASAISNPAKMLSKIPEIERDRCFHYKPVWQRFLIVLAGPAINLVFAVFLFTGLFAAVGEYVAEPVISEITPDSAADAAGFQVGDRFLEVNGNTIETFNNIRPIVAMRGGEETLFVIERDGRIIELVATPEKVVEKDPLGNDISIGRLGVSSTSMIKREYNIFEAFAAGTKRTYTTFGLMLETIGRLITGSVSIKELGGPIKIAQFTGYSASLGLWSFISFMALISVNLGLVNLLPIPLLDGGHLLFYSIEAVKGSPISVKAQEMAAMIGLAFVLGLLFVLTWNDLRLPGLS